MTTNKPFSGRKRGKPSRFDESVQRAVVYDYEIVGLSRQEIVLKYGLRTPSLIGHWRLRYSSEIAAMKLKPDLPKEQTDTPSASSGQDLNAELDDARLKIIALEMMLDIAEKELGVNIRKKFGTRQSGK